jgi:(2Fe-2S) ferredoxin
LAIRTKYSGSTTGDIYINEEHHQHHAFSRQVRRFYQSISIKTTNNILRKTTSPVAPPLLRLPDELLTDILSRVLSFPREYAISAMSYRGIRPQDCATLIDRRLSDRYENLRRVSSSFERVALGALLITRKPAELIGATRQIGEPAADETLRRSSLSMPAPLLWVDWMLKFPGCWQHVRKLRLMLREGPLVELDALVDGVCEVMSRCELQCEVTVIVRVQGETYSKEGVPYERLSKAKIERFVEGLAERNKRVIRLEVEYSYYY